MSEPTPLFPPLSPRQAAPQLWRIGGFVDDPWIDLQDDAALPSDGHALISLARWRSNLTSLSKVAKPLGIRLNVGDELNPANDFVEHLAVIALPFPKFSDGRSYSTARRLREAGYAGEIRATGDVLLDQIPLMLRAGFDALKITNAATLSALATSELPAVERIYQSGSARNTAPWLPRRAGILV